MFLEMSGENKGDGPSQSKKPVDNDFQQQRLRAWQPLLTPGWVIVTFTVVGVLFMILGAICLSASKAVIEVESDTYRDPVTTGTTDIITVDFPPIPADMAAPVYFYYKLTNFYQNHRRYVKSRSDPQLRGDDNPDTTNCDPLEKNGASPARTYYPCGLIANSMFNDQFYLTRRSAPGIKLQYNNQGISWESDRKDKFKARAPVPVETTVGYRNQPLPRVDDEDFIVWMRTAGLPTFKKLKFIITEDLKKDDVISVQINSTFEVKSFGGSKAMVLSTANWLGGKNDFLGIAYLVVGAICLLLALAFGLKHKFSPRPLGDMKYFNWPGIGRANAANARS
jgi:hypothetical protein